jgi:Zn-dependent protease with chaperone function
MNTDFSTIHSLGGKPFMNDWKQVGIALMTASMLVFSSGCNTIESRKDDAPEQKTEKVGKADSKQQEEVGIEVGEMSSIRTMVSAQELENAARQEYHALLQEAKSKGVLAPASDAQAKRLNAIAQRIIPFVKRFNPEAEKWKWEINLIRSKEINAFCMPGGKIAFYTGLNDALKATDDEIAIVMGHEMAHALREHARAQIAKNQATSVGVGLLGQVVGKGQYAKVFDFAGNMLTLKFSRDDESEADLVGLDLAARAGYDPRAGVTLWKKMAAASSGSQMPWFSTHPSSSNRVEVIEANLPKVMPLYEARATKSSGAKATTKKRKK